MNKLVKHNELRKKLFAQQNGLCSFCGKGRLCSKCDAGKKHEECKWQEINTLDHNHSHIDCKGCDLCVRGMVHKLCNWNVIPLLERNPQLQNDAIKEYLSTGTCGFGKRPIVSKNTISKQNYNNKSMLDNLKEVLKSNNNEWGGTIKSLYETIKKNGYRSNNDTTGDRSLNTQMFHQLRGKSMVKRDHRGFIILIDENA